MCPALNGMSCLVMGKAYLLKDDLLFTLTINDIGLISVYSLYSLVYSGMVYTSGAAIRLLQLISFLP